MDACDSRKLSDIVDRVSAWIPRRMEPANVSRDFWMPDQSCRVCYECDSIFTIFNRRHHCRLCGRIFCTRCTANSIPPPAEEGSARTGREDRDRIRVCNYCFKQWQQGGATVDCRMAALSPGLSTSPSNASLVSSYSSFSGNSGSSVGLTPYLTGPYQHVSHSTGQSPGQNSRTDETVLEHYQEASCAGTSGSVDARDPFAAQYSFSRNSDEDTDYSVYKQHSEPSYFSPCDALCSAANCADISHDYGLADSHSYGDKNEPNSEDFTQLPEDTEAHGLESKVKIGKEAEGLNDVATSEASPSYDATVSDGEPLDFENNGILWIPPEAEAEEDEQDANPFEDDDEEEEGRDDSVGEWGYLRTPDSFGSWEEHRTTVQYTLDKSFRGLVIQLLEGENLPLYDEDEKEGWLEIITSLSWEAATLLKPDMSKGGGMDPGGYVKVKCIACGHRSESMVVKGVVCKKNVAHRRMASKVDRPRLCILGGALEYQRVANHLSSFDTLLQQEMDHLKMAVAKIDAHHPNVLLVEKSVSRFAQDYLLAKDISLVLNIKRPLLERISRCTGAQIVPSVDHLTVQQLGFCDSFHVEKFLEEHGSAGKGGKKLTKTLMFFEGCPRPLGFTILLKGANGDELKLVKHVVQYAVFAAYHLALETSFLADEGASLPELSLKAPVKVAVPDKSSVDRSMSTTIQEFTSPCNDHAMKAEDQSGFMVLGNNAPSYIYSTSKEEFTFSGHSNLTQTIQDHLNSMTSFCHSGDDCSHHAQEVTCGYHGTNGKEITEETPSSVSETPLSIENIPMDNLVPKCSSNFVGLPLQSHANLSPGNSSASKLASLDLDSKGRNSEVAPLHEEFSPSASSKKSLLVSLMTRCTWNGSVCERAHLFRIKYYGTCDRPLGRVLSEQLLDQNYRCQSCQMPSEAHIHCYTHQQGSVTVLVKKFPEVSLPREQKRKIWMWHRCLKCPRTNGFPPTTKRKLMSDATWGLSFGKFLEMCFSSHASANRVASCGHSLHRDCLRFHGLGSMVACFYYAPIVVHSVHLPPPKLEFNYDLQEWIKREADEVCRRAELLFSEVVKSLHQISENIPLNNGNRVPELMQQIKELKVMQQKERKEFEVLLHQAINRTLADRRPAVDILEINRLRRQLIIHSYVWDQRLIHVSNLKNDNGMNNLVQKLKEIAQSGHFADISSSSKHGKGFRSCDSFLLNLNLEGTFIQGPNGDFNLPDGNHERSDIDQGSNNPKNAVDVYDTFEPNFSEQQNPEHVKAVRRVLSDGQFQTAKILSDTLDAAWTGESHPADLASNADSSSDSDSHLVGLMSAKANHNVDMDRTVPRGCDHLHSAKGNKETSVGWVTMPFLGLYHSFIRNSMVNEQSLDMIGNYNHVYIRSLRELLQQGSARLLLPGGISDIVLPVYDDEPTSIIAYALLSPDYHNQMISDPIKEGLETSPSLPILDSENLLSLPSLDGASSGFLRGSGSVIESSLSTSISRGSSTTDLRPHNNALHVKVSFSDNGPLGKVKYTVICYYAEQFEALRRTCCPSELDFIRSLSRCKKWGAQGGKSNVFFAKTLDDRFIIKQVTKTELDSFIIFGPAYFKYLSESLNSGSPTCLAKILGIYQVASKHVKGGKEIKMDVLVMENLLFNRNITKLYDLKGSARSRYNSDSSGSNKVLLDQNLLEAMPTSPIFVGTKAKRLLERAVWNDTAFLASIDVMDYSLLVGLDEEKHELVLGIIDFMRQYTWDKHLETWVKASGFLGGPKNATPTVISPVQYKKRFRKAMSTYFLMLPDQWSTPTVIPTHSQSDEQFEET